MFSNPAERCKMKKLILAFITLYSKQEVLLDSISIQIELLQIILIH